MQGLETIEFQISRFDELVDGGAGPDARVDAAELETEKASVTTLADAWKAGDAPTVERIVLQDLRKEPGMYQRLLVERNKDWLPKIEALFARKGRSFVVVGAAHLVGPTACSRCSRPRATPSSSYSADGERCTSDERCSLLFSLTAVVASLPAQQRSIDEFFARFTADWVRQNPNQAASTRFFTGEEQRQFERQITPLTPEWRRARVDARRAQPRRAQPDREGLHASPTASASRPT